MKDLNHIEMSKLDLIRLISDISKGGDVIATIVIDGKSIALKKIRKLCIGPMLVIIESDDNKNVEIEDGSDGLVSVNISDTNYDE